MSIEDTRAHEALLAAARHLTALVPEDVVDRPPVICLCGSTRFKDTFERVAAAQTRAGRIVLTVNEFGNDGHAEKAHLRPVGPEEKARLDELHLRKIDLAGSILVLNVGGYVGESTRAEIAYAEARGKPVFYLEGHDTLASTVRSAVDPGRLPKNSHEWPPRPGDVWEDRDGDQWVCLGVGYLAYLPEMANDVPEEIWRAHGPLRRVTQIARRSAHLDDHS